MRPQLVASSMSQLAEAERRIAGAAERAVAARRMAHLRDPNTGGPIPVYDAAPSPQPAPTPTPVDAERRRQIALRVLAIQMGNAASTSALK